MQRDTDGKYTIRLWYDCSKVMTHLDHNDEGMEGLMKSFLMVNNAVITYWWNDKREVQFWHTTDWDNAGYSVVKAKAEEYNLVL